MPKIRNITFGYKIRNGEIVRDENESKIVAEIFNEYINGLSLKRIAEKITRQGVKYRSNTTSWNKNAVKRIIDCEKYLGTEKYPQIISQQDFDIANSIKVKKYTGKNITAEKEEAPSLPPLVIIEYKPTISVMKLNNEISRELEKTEIDIENIKLLILKCTAEKFTSCCAERSKNA